MRRSVKYWIIRLGNGSFYRCVEGGRGLLGHTTTMVFYEHERGLKELKKLQKHWPAANLVEA